MIVSSLDVLFIVAGIVSRHPLLLEQDMQSGLAK
jgi:hypothetical protein